MEAERIAENGGSTTRKTPVLTFWEVTIASSVVVIFIFGLLSVYLTMPLSDYSFHKFPRSSDFEAGIALGELRSVADLYDIQSIATLFLIEAVSVTPTLMSKKVEECP